MNLFLIAFMIWAVGFSFFLFYVRGEGALIEHHRRHTWGVVSFLGVYLMVGVVAHSCISCLAPKHWISAKTEHLASLRSADGIHGRFFLGTGTINTTPSYLYYKEVWGGGFQQEQTAIGNHVAVFEEDRKDGVLVTQVLQYEDPSVEKNTGIHLSETRYEFHIPKGTLKKEFSIR